MPVLTAFRTGVRLPSPPLFQKDPAAGQTVRGIFHFERLPFRAIHAADWRARIYGKQKRRTVVGVAVGLKIEAERG